jgi:monovalent cation/proton antiporter MnhG/PhaG subunit
MTVWLGSLFLILGSLLAAIAALGVVRLPDFFMRMHAATKAGVAGCGLLLVGVGLVDGSPSTWAKVVVAVAFLLLTTPVAAHLLGRAGYVGGTPLWRGTASDALAGVLGRGRFGRTTTPIASDPIADVRVGNGTPSAKPELRRVVVALASGPNLGPAIDRSIALARAHAAELCGVAIVDTKRLSNVGPVPIGAGWYAQQMRERRIALARAAAADAIEHFGNAAAASGLRWSVQLEEGRPRAVLRSLAAPDVAFVAGQGAWFDQGVLGSAVEVSKRLRGIVTEGSVAIVGDERDARSPPAG